MKRLRRAGRTFGSLKLFHDFAVLASGQLGAKLLGFVAFAYLARVLDLESYGGVEYVVGLTVFFAALVDGGLGAIGVRRAAKNPEVLAKLAFQIPAARLAIALGAAPVMVLVAANAMRSDIPTTLIWLFALSLITAPWRQEWLMQASERMGAAAISQVIRAAVFLGGAWLLVRSNADLVAVGWIEIASAGAATLYCIAIQHAWITPFRVKGSFDGFWPLIREGAAVSSTNLVWSLIQTLPLIIIIYVSGAVQGALFAAAARLAGSILTFSNLYHFNLFPAVARAGAADRSAMSGLLSRSFRVVSWGGCLAALTLTLFAEDVVRLAFGPKLVDAAPILAILIWTLPIALCSGHARWGLTALGEQRKVLFAHLWGLGLLAVLCPALGSAWGAEGYAAGAAAGPLGIWIAAHLYARGEAIEPPSLLLALAPAAGAALAVGLAHHFDWGALGRLALLGAFALIAPVIDRRLLGDLLELGRAKAKGPPDHSDGPST